MNFELSEEQQLVIDSVQRFVNDNYELEKRQKLAASKQGFSDEYWQTMAELGWLGLSLDEADGGFGGNQIDTMLVMEQFGKGLVLEPYLASIVLGAKAISAGGSIELKADLMPGVIDGTKQLALAYAEEQARFDTEDIITHATPCDDGFTINGTKSMVTSGATASHIVVSTRTSGGQVDQNGITLFCVPTDVHGLKVTGFPTVDGLQAAEIEFNNVFVERKYLLGKLDQGYELLNTCIKDGMKDSIMSTQGMTNVSNTIRIHIVSGK